MRINYILIFFFVLCLSCKKQRGEYVCPPCDLPCDTLFFDKAGICPHCQMKLVKKTDLIDESKLVVNEIKIATGTGVFLMEGGTGREEKSIKVYYHKPENYSNQSKILWVIPGAGRNGDSYRDAWKEASEKHSVLILSPMFEEQDYSFEDYHMCGLMKETNLAASITFVEKSNWAKLDEEQFKFQLNPRQEEWIFSDFDRIFDRVVEALGSSQTNYDLYGHSAGGQILHRMTLFHMRSKARQIIATNAGFYTLPSFETAMPFGIKDTHLDDQTLKIAFAKRLTVLVGALDNETEQRGTLLRSKTVDEQGMHRLARGKYFYDLAKAKAEEMQVAFNWTLTIIPNVGHDHEQMGREAAKLLFEPRK